MPTLVLSVTVPLKLNLFLLYCYVNSLLTRFCTQYVLKTIEFKYLQTIRCNQSINLSFIAQDCIYHHLYHVRRPTLLPVWVAYSIKLCYFSFLFSAQVLKQPSPCIGGCRISNYASVSTFRLFDSIYCIYCLFLFFFVSDYAPQSKPFPPLSNVRSFASWCIACSRCIPSYYASDRVSSCMNSMQSKVNY